MSPRDEYVLSLIRTRLPEKLRPLWQLGLTIMFAIGASLTLLLSQENVDDYVRIFGWAQAAYIELLALQIVRVNWDVRRHMVNRGGPMPQHIMLLALGTMMSVALLSAVMASNYGSAPNFPALPWLVNACFLVKILGLNVVWQVVTARRGQDNE